jgi:hypothetical protein
MSCQNNSRFQDAKDLANLSVLATVSLGLNSLLPLFLMVSDSTFKDA